jgi:hypothetical protein
MPRMTPNKPAPVQESAAGDLIEVQSKIHDDLRQPSTGKWIRGNQMETLLDDGWLENQINAGLLKKV